MISTVRKPKGWPRWRWYLAVAVQSWGNHGRLLPCHRHTAERLKRSPLPIARRFGELLEQAIASSK